jgi:hypothetical protein
MRVNVYLVLTHVSCQINRWMSAFDLYLCGPSTPALCSVQSAIQWLPAGNRSQRGTGCCPPPSAKIGCIWNCNSILLCVAAWWLINHSDSFVVLRFEKGLMPWMWDLLCLRNSRSRYLSIRCHTTLKQPLYSSPWKHQKSSEGKRLFERPGPRWKGYINMDWINLIWLRTWPRYRIF